MDAPTPSATLQTSGGRTVLTADAAQAYTSIVVQRGNPLVLSGPTPVALNLQALTLEDGAQVIIDTAAQVNAQTTVSLGTSTITVTGSDGPAGAPGPAGPAGMAGLPQGGPGAAGGSGGQGGQGGNGTDAPPAILNLGTASGGYIIQDYGGQGGSGGSGGPGGSGGMAGAGGTVGSGGNGGAGGNGGGGGNGGNGSTVVIYYAPGSPPPTFTVEVAPAQGGNGGPGGPGGSGGPGNPNGGAGPAGAPGANGQNGAAGQVIIEQID